MRFLLTIATTWAACIAPQMCRIGALTSCCADGAHRQSVAERPETCSSSCCDEARPKPDDGSAPTDNRDCRDCENFCVALVKPSDSGDLASRLQSQAVMCLPASSSVGSGCINGLGQSVGQPVTKLPRLPRPPSDFPLLN